MRSRGLGVLEVPGVVFTGNRPQQQTQQEQQTQQRPLAECAGTIEAGRGGSEGAGSGVLPVDTGHPAARPREGGGLREGIQSHRTLQPVRREPRSGKPSSHRAAVPSRPLLTGSSCWLSWPLRRAHSPPIVGSLHPCLSSHSHCSEGAP